VNLLLGVQRQGASCDGSGHSASTVRLVLCFLTSHQLKLRENTILHVQPFKNPTLDQEKRQCQHTDKLKQMLHRIHNARRGRHGGHIRIEARLHVQRPLASEVERKRYTLQ
jgi:hypothetical protein